MALGPDTIEALSARLAPVLERVERRFPGERGERQPVHTVYGGAHLFRADTARRLGELGLAALERYGEGPEVFAEVLGLGEVSPEALWERVVQKLEREPVEDFRLDFEDGYGNRADEEEDADAAAAAEQVARGMEQRSLPPFIGIRVKPLTAELHRRSLRTLDIFVDRLVQLAGGLPQPFVVTLPKIVVPEQVAVLAEALSLVEQENDLPRGSIGLELMLETTQMVIGPEGLVGARRFVDAGAGRVTAAHFGTYDYTASCQITAAHQSMTHPACDFARHVQQVSLAGSGVWLSDGATNVMPVPVHRGPDLSPEQETENRRVVRAAWRLHADHVRHSLYHGFYQGWDLHPAQLPSRYASVFAFFLAGLPQAATRLRNFVEQAAKATLVGEVFDDAATGQGLLNHFLRAINSGAVSEEETVETTGLSLDEIRSRSFVEILARRRG